MSIKKTSILVPLIHNSIRTFSNSKTLLCKVDVLRPCCIFQHIKTYSTNKETNALSANKDDSGISKAMRAYLERSQAEEKFMEQQISEYDIGKRHLANMMGENPETFTQKDIDDAIAYLLPSGLFNPPARPMMKPPHEVFPKRKSAEFDVSGRPFHSLFYTGRPNYYSILQEIAIKAGQMDRVSSVPDRKIDKDIASSTWVSQEEFEKIVLEKVPEDLYEFFIRSMDRLINHPKLNLEKEAKFFMTFRQFIKSAVKEEVPQLMYNDAGIPYMTSSQRRKMGFADVTVYGKGSGKFTINGSDILYFEYPQDRDQVLFPLQFTSLLGLVDVDVVVRGGGTTGQSGSIRYALAMALRSFVDEDTREKMRIAGLLTRDRRQGERKKPGQFGARAKFTWKAR